MRVAINGFGRIGKLVFRAFLEKNLNKSQQLQINAIKLNIQNPFKWSSGWNSPIYCDNRICLSYPKVRDFLVNSIAEEIKKKTAENFIIAGVATGAIGIGILVANKLNVPFIYVRPEQKKHGRENQI